MRICCFVQTEDSDLDDTPYVTVHEQENLGEVGACFLDWGT